MAVVLVACTQSVATPIGSPSQTPGATPWVSVTPSATGTLTALPTPPASLPALVGWSQLTSSGPAAREDHTWTVTGDGSAALLFGGRDGAMVFGDVWAFSMLDDSWVPLRSDGGPFARFGHEAVWVEDVGLVVFAGQNGPDFFNDLWAYDPTDETWRELPSDGAVPVPRYGTCAAIGPDGRLWISHGFTADGSRFADTRAYDFDIGVWTDETPAGDEARPVERCLHGCWWTEDGAFSLFGGQTTGVTALGDHWLLANQSWSEDQRAAPPARNLYAFVRIADATFVFGGQGLDGSYLDDFWWVRDDDFDAADLTDESDGPPARGGATMVFDSFTGRGLLFGGRDAHGALADVWQFQSNFGLPGG